MNDVRNNNAEVIGYEVTLNSGEHLFVDEDTKNKILLEMRQQG